MWVGNGSPEVRDDGESRRQWWKPWAIGVAGLLGVGALVQMGFVAWKAHDVYFGPEAATDAALFATSASTLTGTFAGLAGLVLAWFTYRRVVAQEQTVKAQEQTVKAQGQQVIIASQQLEVARQTEITNQFGQAIGHLGSREMSVRLGGLYTLRRLATTNIPDPKPGQTYDDPQLRTVIEVISAFARERSREIIEELDDLQRSRLSDTDVDPLNFPPSPTDIATAVQIVGSIPTHSTQASDLTHAYMHGIQLDGLTFVKTRFDLAKLTGTNFTRATLTNARFFRATLTGTTFERATLTDTHFIRATLTNARFDSAKLTSTDFSNATLTGTNFTGTTLTDSRFSGLTLTRSTFHTATLINTDFFRAKIIDTNFLGAKITNTNFIRAKITDTNFTRAKITNTNFLAAKITNTSFRKSTLDDSQITGPTGQLADLVRVLGPKGEELGAGWERA